MKIVVELRLYIVNRPLKRSITKRPCDRIPDGMSWGLQSGSNYQFNPEHMRSASFLKQKLSFYSHFTTVFTQFLCSVFFLLHWDAKLCTIVFYLADLIKESRENLWTEVSQRLKHTRFTTERPEVGWALKTFSRRLWKTGEILIYFYKELYLVHNHDIYCLNGLIYLTKLSWLNV